MEIGYKGREGQLNVEPFMSQKPKELLKSPFRCHMKVGLKLRTLR